MHFQGPLLLVSGRVGAESFFLLGLNWFIVYFGLILRLKNPFQWTMQENTEKGQPRFVTKRPPGNLKKTQREKSSEFSNLGCFSDVTIFRIMDVGVFFLLPSCWPQEISQFFLFLAVVWCCFLWGLQHVPGSKLPWHFHIIGDKLINPIIVGVYRAPL